MQPSSVGQLLRHFRGRSGWTQEQLAEQAGLPRDTICKIEQGARPAPRCHTIHKLAVALCLSPDECAALELAAHHISPAVTRLLHQQQTRDSHMAYVTAVFKGIAEVGHALESDTSSRSA